jgi:predicted dinucleotide-binding enzyme
VESLVFQSGAAEVDQQAGHRVTYASRNSKEPVLPAVRGVNLVFFATQFEGAIEIVERPEIRAELARKIVVDLSNPLPLDYIDHDIRERARS